MPTDVMEQMLNAFRAEALDLLMELDSALLALEQEASDTTLVHRVFRAIHTIKGSGATAGCVHLARFAHQVEEAFDLAREGRLAITPELIDCALKACDVVRLILEQKSEEGEVAGEAEVTASFTRLLPSAAAPRQKPSEQSKEPAEIRSAFQIIFKPNRDIFFSGADPVTLLDDLRALGQAHVTAHTDQVPPLFSLDAERCYLWWEVLLVTERDQAAIQDVFVFVEDECELHIRRREDQAVAVALLGSVPTEMLELFVLESEDHLDGMEKDALALETDPAAASHLDSLFRSVHSIKGNAGLILEHVDSALRTAHPVQLLLRMAHALESLLDTYRGVNAGPVPEETVHTALEVCDAARLLLSSLTRGTEALVSTELLARLGLTSNAAPSGHTDGREAAFLNTTSQCIEMIAGCFLRMESDPESMASAVETYRRGLQMLSAAAQYRSCPGLEEPLREQLRILTAAAESGTALGSAERAALQEAYLATRSVLNRTPDQATISSQPPERAAAAPPPAQAPSERPAAAASPSTIRIDQSKLDRLMRVVGELLVARGAFPLLIQKLSNGAECAALVKDLKDAGADISRIADELQTSVMSIRMLPVRTVFQKFPRLVRDLARSLGKEIRLLIEGEDIELDKTILEQIGDPLVHLIRNAVDHGCETAEQRRAKGKDASGQVTLRASNQAGGVVIEVTDDGRGLDAAALKRKAVEKGLLTPEASAGMGEEAAFQLVFLPGLTTAAKITDVSGRGVGMDVVHSNIRNLQGTIEIRSKLDRGSTFLIKLPTSLMVSKGILLQAGSQEYILPLGNISDMVKLPPEDAHRSRGLTLAQIRGTIYSMFNLAEMLGLAPAKTPELSVAIVETGAVKYGLIVDRFITEVEVLVKPLQGGLEQCREFQGAAIMGDGRVVLVLNPLECHSLSRTQCN
ncbi:MAG: chemotaxis protein CheA [Candidatus Korobacteraceae bacterium]